jgi:hypothetical protein
VFIGFGPPQAIAFPSANLPAPIAPQFYGWTREGPDITENVNFYQVMNDLTGPRLSMDEGFAGREDLVSLVMTAWDQNIDNQLENQMNPTAARANGVARGQNALSDMGTLMISEGLTCGMWLVKMAGTKAVNIAVGLPLGRYYMCTICVGPNKPIEGNKENMRVRVFRAKRNLWQVNAGVLGLFREDAAAFAALPPITFGP